MRRQAAQACSVQQRVVLWHSMGGRVPLSPPGHAPDELRLMIRTAKACAGADPTRPFLAVCVLPRKPNEDCHRLYTDTCLAIRCHTLATFKKGYFHYGAPAYSFISPPAEVGTAAPPIAITPLQRPQALRFKSLWSGPLV